MGESLLLNHNKNGNPLLSILTLKVRRTGKVDYSNVWLQRGILLKSQNKDYLAIKMIDHALKLNPSYTEAWTLRGDILLKLNRYEEAICSYDHALKINIKCEAAWRNKGNTLLFLRQIEEALKAYEQAILLCPEDYDVVQSRKISFYSIGRAFRVR